MRLMLDELNFYYVYSELSIQVPVSWRRTRSIIIKLLRAHNLSWAQGTIAIRGMNKDEGGVIEEGETLCLVLI